MLRGIMLRTIWLILALSLAFATCCFAQRRGNTLPAKELTPAQREQLSRDKLIIGAKNYRQIFSPYLALGKRPDDVRFITSDAALAAYHGLFEESFRELELRRAARLRGDLEKLYNACKPSTDDSSQDTSSPDDQNPPHSPYPPNLIQHILGPALVILGFPATTENFSEKLLPEINRQAALIRAAQKMECPPWLNYRRDDPFFKIDYQRCRPVSFYADYPALADYHRVVRWLQLVPLRATNDDELAAWARMVSASRTRFARDQPGFVASFTGLSVFVGPVADRSIIVNNLDILSACACVPDDSRKRNKNLAHLRELLLGERQNSPRSAINGDIRSRPKRDASPLSEIRFRVMPAHMLPDAEILSAFLDGGIHPSGLTVAAFLGSSFAHERMTKIDAGKWAAANKRARLLLLPQDGQARSLHADYIDVLRTLNAPPIKEAPAFMHSLPWQIKTCQTQLASWSQIRHTFALEALISSSVLGIERPPPPPPGFVEPNPVFWREYVRLVERTIALLDANDVFTPSTIAFAQHYRATADEIEEAGFTKDDASLDILQDWKKSNILHNVSRAMQMDKEPQAQKLAAALSNRKFATSDEMRDACKQAVALFRAYADKIERGEMKPQVKETLDSLPNRWNTLVVLSRQLETILAKQLDEIELTDSERLILIEYGYTVASTMGYLDLAGHEPRDDAPRWAEVAHDPNTGESLGVGTGRARALFVLYPWRGGEVLCTGAVLSYYEEWAPAKRLTDKEWKRKLDSADAPAPTEWLAPILAR